MMVEQIILKPEALGDVLRGYSWYEQRSAGLGDRFLWCVDDCLRLIARNPDLFQIVYKQYRQVIVRRFPYSIIYRYEGGIIMVFSVFHSAQDPEKWQEQLE